MSLYSGSPVATVDHVKNECKRLKAAFPQLQPEYIALLMQRINDKRVSADQLTDSVNNLIDNFRYPTPTVADVLSWDKKVKLYTHAEVVADIPKGFEFTDYEMITISDQKRWIRKA